MRVFLKHIPSGWKQPDGMCPLMQRSSVRALLNTVEPHAVPCVQEIEEAMLAQRIEIAVHSMKGMPTPQPAGLTIAAFLAREDARDVLIAGDIKRHEASSSTLFC